MHSVQSSFPLAIYAAEHWVDHAQFEKVSLRVQDGMQRLFNQSRPYFSVWVKLYDIDIRYDPELQRETTFAGSPLYYASLCGFLDLAEHLLVKNPQDVNARGGLHQSPLTAALRNRHFHVAELLYQHGAVTELVGYNSRTLLLGGRTDAVQWLLRRGANVNLQQNDGRTSSLNIGGGRLQRYLRSFRGYAGAPIDHGDSPLHLASVYGRFETMQLLIQRGADVSARDNTHSTPLHLAACSGRAESIRLLIQHGADVNVQNKSKSIPLHLVFTSTAHETDRATTAEAADVLLQNGADVNARDGRNSTPLHLALHDRDAYCVQLLIQHGADVNALDKGSSTPLHLAVMSQSMCNIESVRLLVQHGADVNARNKRKSTPLHLASSRQDGVARLLLEHGAIVDAKDDKGRTPDEIAFSTFGQYLTTSHT
ncbi:Ankyrin repeat-containing domain protein [Lactarius tabidus]